MSLDLAPNLGQRAPDTTPAQALRAAHAWFPQARFGMFVHYGLFSVLGRGEWIMFNEKIPIDRYNPLADEFRAERFDAGALVALAKRGGAGYVVMVTRHHDGFCLWDTRTTPFNTARTAARRDLVREYTDACRRAGLRVGLYHSLMSWQWPATYVGPEADPAGWRAMVDETHAQVRELMTDFGRIDLLWYDGCVVPGVSDPETIARHWCSAELNAMVRSLQPDILINDRSSLPEDFSTPEQHLTLPQRHRLWEMCMTIGDCWGWRKEDKNLKSATTLIRQLVFCARYGGNLLLNVGPLPDGSIPADQAERLESIGRWMAVNGEAVRGTRRTPYTEADHLLGLVTSGTNRLYFHPEPWPGRTGRVAGLERPVLAARLLASGTPVSVDQAEDGTATLHFSDTPSDPLATVVALEFGGEAPQAAPPDLLVEKDTGLYAPAEAAVQPGAADASNGDLELRFVAPVSGRYELAWSLIADHPVALEAFLDGAVLPGPHAVVCRDYPNTLRAPSLSLQEGQHRLQLRAAAPASIRLQSWRLQPAWKVVPSECWRIIGPFPSPFRVPGTDREVREAMDTVFPPEKEYLPAAAYPGTGGGLVRWQALAPGRETIDFTQHLAGQPNGVFFARTVLHSPAKRRAEILLGCDWWANVFVNGGPVASRRSTEAIARDHAAFNGWKPIAARIDLQPGANSLVVKCHQGRAGNWFALWVHDAEDLVVST